MSNLITEIYDKQAVVDNLNQLGELINSSLNAIVASAPKLQSPIEYLTAVQSISEIEKKNTEVTQAKAKALSDLDKAYKQADNAIQQSINLDDAEFQAQTKLTSQYKERAKEQKQLLELERTRQQTMQNGTKLLQMEAKSEGELRMQQQQLIKAQQSLRVTNAEENALREKLIAKINANKEALKGMSDEVSKQRDNIGNYKSALEGNANVLGLVANGQLQLKEAMRMVRVELTQLETLQASGTKLTAEQQQRYQDLNNAMGQLADVQGDISARTKALANDYLGMNTALEGVKLGVNIMTSLQSVTALLGGENEELQKAMAKVVATQQILNTVTQIQKQLNKDSELMTGLVALKHKFLTTQIIAETKAQTALNVAKLGLVGAVAAAVGALGYMIVKMASAQNATADLSAELNKQASEAIGNDVAKITELKSQWDKLGGTMEEKRAYLEKYNEKLEELGLHFNNVNELETFMNEHTQDYIDAISARAKAEAARSILAEKTSEFVKSQLDYERQNIQGQQTFWERFQRMVLDWQVGRTEASKMVHEAYEAEQKDMQDQIDTTIELINKYQEEADTLFAGLPVKEDDKKKTKEQTQATKELTNALASEDEVSLLSALRELNKMYAETDKAFEDYIKWVERKKEITSENIKIEEEEAEKVETLTELRKRLAKEEEEMLKKRKEAIQDAKENLTKAFEAITQSQLDNLERQSDAYDENYERRKQAIENTVMSEEEKDRRLKALDNEKTAHDRQVAKQRAEIERRQAIFQNAIASAEAMSKAVASVGELLTTSARGDTYTVVARYIAAIAAGVTAVTTISSLIAQLIKIPAFEKGGTAEANKPFIAGEKGHEIGFGVYSGKVYDFSKPTLFKANEPINIKNANETRQIINNNEYNKDVTLHNEVVVQVIDNKRIEKFFKIW